MLDMNQVFTLLVLAITISASYGQSDELLDRNHHVVHDYTKGTLRKYVEGVAYLQPVCPDFTEKYKRDHKMDHQRSISPYRYIINRNETRYPKDIIETECLCSGCIDPGTGRETTQGLRSVDIVTHEWVRFAKNGRYGNWEKIKIKWGCRCDKEYPF